MKKLSPVLVVLGLLAVVQSAVAGDPGTTRGIIDLGKLERPADAVTLVGPDGYNLIPEGEAPTKWVFAGGILTASPAWDSVLTRESYRDFRMHVEFNGNVAAVLAEKYWDRELTAAKAKDNEIKQRAKKLATEGKLTPVEERAALEKMRTEGLTERERRVLEKGISNLEFHYLGSAKILGGVGRGLAEAMAELLRFKQLKNTNS